MKKCLLVSLSILLISHFSFAAGEKNGLVELPVRELVKDPTLTEEKARSVVETRANELMGLLSQYMERFGARRTLTNQEELIRFNDEVHQAQLRLSFAQNNHTYASQRSQTGSWRYYTVPITRPFVGAEMNLAAWDAKKGMDQNEESFFTVRTPYLFEVATNGQSRRAYIIQAKQRKLFRRTQFRVDANRYQQEFTELTRLPKRGILAGEDMPGVIPFQGESHFRLVPPQVSFESVSYQESVLDTNGKEWLFVMMRNGKILIADPDEGFTHTTLALGYPIASAGMIVVKDGIPTKISDRSPQYSMSLPDASDARQLRQLFLNQFLSALFIAEVDLKKTIIEYGVFNPNTDEPLNSGFTVASTVQGVTSFPGFRPSSTSVEEPPADSSEPVRAGASDTQLAPQEPTPVEEPAQTPTIVSADDLVDEVLEVVEVEPGAVEVIPEAIPFVEPIALPNEVVVTGNEASYLVQTIRVKQLVKILKGQAHFGKEFSLVSASHVNQVLEVKGLLDRSPVSTRSTVLLLFDKALLNHAFSLRLRSTGFTGFFGGSDLNVNSLTEQSLAAVSERGVLDNGVTSRANRNALWAQFRGIIVLNSQAAQALDFYLTELEVPLPQDSKLNITQWTGSTIASEVWPSLDQCQSYLADEGQQ